MRVNERENGREWEMLLLILNFVARRQSMARWKCEPSDEALWSAAAGLPCRMDCWDFGVTDTRKAKPKQQPEQAPLDIHLDAWCSPARKKFLANSFFLHWSDGQGITVILSGTYFSLIV